MDWKTNQVTAVCCPRFLRWMVRRDGFCHVALRDSSGPEMTSHEVAQILLGKPNVPLVIKKFLHNQGGELLVEACSVSWTNLAHFEDASGFRGDEEYHSGRECVEIK